MMLSAEFHRVTLSERVAMRDELYSQHCEVKIWPVDDNLWACDVSGFIFEAPTVGELLRFLADVAEEV